MSDSNARPAIARIWLRRASFVLAVLVFNSCKQDGGAPTALADAKDGLVGPPEDMPEMESYTQAINFGVGAAPDGVFDGYLICGNPQRCGNKTEVHISITPSPYAPSVDWDKALGHGNGHVVAKVTNLDNVRFDKFDIDGGETLYLWVGAMKGDAAKATGLYSIKHGDAKRRMKFRGQDYCSRPAPPPGVHILPPPDCPAPQPFAPQQSSIEPFSAVGSYLIHAITRAFLAPQPIDGLWISCSYGCCEVQLS